VCPLTEQKTATGGDTHGGWTICRRKTRSLPNDTVESWGLSDRISKRTDRIKALLIRHQKDNIRLFRHAGSGPLKKVMLLADQLQITYQIFGQNATKNYLIVRRLSFISC